MGETHEGLTRRDFNAQFFSQLAGKSVRFCLTRVHFTAGKFPATRHVLASGSLRDEYAAVAVVERRRDDKEIRLQPLLHARQRAVTVLELLSRSAGAKLVTSNLALPTNKRALRVGDRMGQ
jgi:hypothetical protein